MLDQCSACNGFLPPHTTACPHCAPLTPPRPDATGTLAKRIRNALMTFAGGGLLMTTLMACYGAPYPPPNTPDECTPTETDKDGDCVDAPNDCDDSNPQIQKGCE